MMKRFLLWVLTGLALVSAGWWYYPPLRVAINERLPPNVLAMLPVTPGHATASAKGDATGTKGEAKRKGPPPAPVTVATVNAVDMPIIISAPGTVESGATYGRPPTCRRPNRRSRLQGGRSRQGRARCSSGSMIV